MSIRVRVLSFTLAGGLAMMGWSFAQPNPNGDQPIVPNPAAPAPTNTTEPEASPSASPSASATPTAPAGIYISDTGNHRIVYIDNIQGSNPVVVGRAGREPGYFLHPAQVWVDPLGKIFVADRDNNRIVRLDSISGGNWTEMGGFNHPEGVASKGDELYVADTGTDRVLVYDELNGKLLRTYSDPRLKHPVGLWLDGNKDLYVSCGEDPPGGKVVKLVEPADTSGAKWQVYEGQNLRPSGFAPSQMVSWKRHMWLIDPISSRLIRVDNFQGRAARELGGYGSAIGKFRAPVGLGLNSEGDLFVADSGNDRVVQVIGLDSKEWKAFSGKGETELRNPTSVFSYCPVPKPLPPPDEDEDEKGKAKGKGKGKSK